MVAAPVVPAVVTPPAAPVVPAAGALSSALGTPQPVTPAAVVAPVVPEKYDLKKPEKYAGADSDVARVEAMAKALKLTPEAAQALFEYDATGIAEDNAAIERETAQVRADNIAAIKSDPEFGGAKYTESLTRADQAFAALDPKGELLAELKKFGLESHPPLVRAFMRAGKLMAEGTTIVQGGTRPTDSKSASLKEMYPTMT